MKTKTKQKLKITFKKSVPSLLRRLSTRRCPHLAVQRRRPQLSIDILPVGHSAANLPAAETDGRTDTRVVSVLDSGAEGPGFKSQSRRYRVTVLGKLFTPIVPLFTNASVHQAAKLVPALLRVAEVTADLAESNGSLPSGL